ncbi:RBBP9/YdeN family alpha/beta hydrolase [Nocardioides zeae]|uniref:Alpha/beta hydrolase family esterase n=1 Tax=Nocardioides zeae TaxID=1457234 RepID=A0AAJ1TW54_9ACTN|nr:alpha/beta hydrolase [Nocardioides zeae]MDQ1103390.1 putative alpha/beta hydrolase family esterase [Nocardioides zeae]
MTPAPAHRRAVIFHGFRATPEDHWFGWLAARLAQHDIPTTVPALPGPAEPDPAAWERAVAAALRTPDAGTCVVAHSLGCLTVLRHLRARPPAWRLGTLVLVSGFVERLPALPELDGFIGDGGDTSGIADRVDCLVVLRSDDDPIVPPELTDRLAARLGVEAQVVPGAGHFMASDGVTALPQVLDVLVHPGSPATPGRHA